MLAQLPASVRGKNRRVIDGGSAHRIVLLGESAAIRIARDPDTGFTMTRRQALVDQLPALKFQLPRSLSEVVTVERMSAVAVEFVPGEDARKGAVSPAELRMLLGELQRIPFDPLVPLLERPMSFCGGDAWLAVQLDQVVPRLPQLVQTAALRAVEALAALEPQHDTFSHGDLGGRNVRWRDGRVLGVVDWDLASVSDRSSDIATLATWHGFDCLQAVATPNDIIRARVRQPTFVLQQLAFTILHERPESEIQRVVQRATASLGPR